MPHLRSRMITSSLLKSMKLWPVINVFGPRQCGKSTLLRELAFKPKSFSYSLLDRIKNRDEAQLNPELFLRRFDQEPLIIDEAHKAPALFDEIKAEVDEDRRPGRFILTGSVSFSKKLGIRESLTGRSAIVRVDSMTLTETLEKKKSKFKDVLRYLKQGGMPGLCFLRDQNQIANYWDEWVETVCHRDLLEQSRGRLLPDLAQKILEQCALLEFPSAQEISKMIRVDTRRVQNHIVALQELFLLRTWSPINGGKPMFLLFDCGLAHHFGANQRRLFQVFLAHHLQNKSRFEGKKDQELNFDLTRGGSFVDIIPEFDSSARIN